MVKKLYRLVRKFWTILYLFFVVANGEKKINLEDIERDNLKAESRSKSDETKYSLKPEINQQHYSTSTYVTPQPVSNIPTEEYRQSNKYSPNEIIYQQSTQPLQQYTEYQQQINIPSKNIPTIYNSQQSIYQPEINVGNQVQSFQQKAITHKFVKSPNKDNFYIDIPMGHFLSYYPHIDLSSLNVGKVQPSFQELTQAQQISIPFYTPLLSQKQLITPVKMAYQILPQYTLRQSIPVSTTLFPKFSKGPIYASITSKKPITPVYEQPEQSYTQGKQLLYTQAYITPSQHQQKHQQQQQQQQQQQHVSPVIYNQGNALYTQTTPLQGDLYVRSPVYVQDNSLHGQINQYNGQTEQSSYLSSGTEQQLPKQILRQEESQSVTQNYVKVPDEPNTDFVPPQVSHQNFKSDVTQLIQVSSEPEESPQVKEHVVSSEPRSLLDTYIPSNLIAAQDSSRYRERPLHLESGFLPSKTNFVQYKKRKTQ